MDISLYKYFRYAFDKGPFLTKEEVLGVWMSGNCRRALQWYFLSRHDQFFSPDELLCPQSFFRTGVYILKEKEKWNICKLRIGDVIFAERIRNKSGEEILSQKNILSSDKYSISLHTAIIVSFDPVSFFHATSFSGSSCIWTQEEFLAYYKVIVVKRFI